MKTIFDAVKNNHSLERLDLSNNQISVERVIALAAALRINNTLKMLDLRNNKVGDKGTKELADAL